MARNDSLKKILFLTVFAAFTVVTSAALALPPFNVDSDGLAIKGYDPVAYFTMGKPLVGDKRFEYRWGEAIWRFSSSEHMKLFMTAPEKYAPQYGGY